MTRIIVYDTIQLLASPYVDTLVVYLKRLRNDNVIINDYVKEVKNATYFLAVDGDTLLGMARCSDLTRTLASIIHVSLSRYKSYKYVSSVYAHS